MKKLLKRILPKIDVFLFVFVYPAAILLKFIRIAGVQRMPLSKKALLRIGVFPIRDHYYEPLFNNNHIKRPLSEDRILPGIDWNIERQLEMLTKFQFNEELKGIPSSQLDADNLDFYFHNDSFLSGDAEFWYNIIRLKKPRRIFEVGSGNSSLMAIKAIKKTTEMDPDYKCKHVCIEPYEMPWLEKTGVVVVRSKIENIDKKLFSEMEENDILFIDSSHVIRPQGDVLFEYLELLPILNKGVIVHIHDIFSPKDYLEEWVIGDVKFWNEQYLLEAFLTSNSSWEIIGALNFLHHNHFEKLKEKCPYLTRDREPGSFYIQKIV